MRTVKVETLSVEAFLPFGFYTNLINPKSEKLGAPPVEFFRDPIQQNLGGATAVSYSTCRVESRPYIIDVSEWHCQTSEGILSLDNEILIHVAPATTPDAPVPLDKIRVFRIPQGTMVVLRPGVWHHAPFTANRKPANVMIALPERIYASDCHVATIAKADQIKISGV